MKHLPFWFFWICAWPITSLHLHALCFPNDLKNMACVVVEHAHTSLERGKHTLNLSDKEKQLAEQMSQKVLNGQRDLHPVVKEALKKSNIDIYVLRLLCAKKKTFLKDNTPHKE